MQFDYESWIRVDVRHAMIDCQTTYDHRRRSRSFCKLLVGYLDPVPWSSKVKNEDCELMSDMTSGMLVRKRCRGEMKNRIKILLCWIIHLYEKKCVFLLQIVPLLLVMLFVTVSFQVSEFGAGAGTHYDIHRPGILWYLVDGKGRDTRPQRTLPAGRNDTEMFREICNENPMRTHQERSHQI